MTTQWTIAALLSTALVAGCNGGGNQDSANIEEITASPNTGAVPADETVALPETSASVDAPAVHDTRAHARAPRQAPRPAPSMRSGAHEAPHSPVETRRPTTSDDHPVRNSARNSEAPAPRLPQFREVTVGAGTAIPMELLTALSSETAQIETAVRARVRQDVIVNGYVAIPAGSIVTGTVTDVDRAGRVQGRSRLAFAFNEVQMNGGREDFRTNPVSFEGEATKGEDATKIGAGAGIGAVIGGILGGGDGAAKGAAIGGAAGAGTVLATRGKEVTVASGTDITATLAQPTTVRAAVR